MNQKTKIIILLTVLTVIFLVLSVALSLEILFTGSHQKFQLRWNKNTIVVSVQEASLKVYQESV
jgi:hypothetical protein